MIKRLTPINFSKNVQQMQSLWTLMELKSCKNLLWKSFWDAEVKPLTNHTTDEQKRSLEKYTFLSVKILYVSTLHQRGIMYSGC